MQGGLEVPCLLIFNGDAKYIEKAQKFVKYAFPSSHQLVDDSSDRDDSPCTLPPPNKKSKGDSQVWSSINGITLSLTHKNGILEGEKLDDLVIDTAQNLLKSQFPRLSGLQSTLLQSTHRTCLRVNFQDYLGSSLLCSNQSSIAL